MDGIIDCSNKLQLSLNEVISPPKVSSLQSVNTNIDINSNQITNNDSNEKSNKTIFHKNDVNNSLLSDSKLHSLVPYFNWKPKPHYQKIVDDNNLKIIKGRFSNEEKSILTNNWNKFCDEFYCDEDIKLRLLAFFSRSNKYIKEERKKFRQFIKRENYLLRIAKDLPNRTLRNIYQNARRMFGPLKRLNEMSESDRQLIKTLNDTIYKKKWTKIVEKINCYPKCVECEITFNYNENGEPFNKGKWSSEEEKNICKAMKTVLNTNDLTQHLLTKNIPFTQILNSSPVNQSPRDALKNWKRNLRWKIANFNQLLDNWSKSDASKLIYCLFKCNFDNECDIYWNFIKKKFSNISSFNNLMKNWRIIKSTVPDFQNKTYKQIIEYLFDNFMPEFLKTDEDLKKLENFYQN